MRFDPAGDNKRAADQLALSLEDALIREIA